MLAFTVGRPPFVDLADCRQSGRILVAALRKDEDFRISIPKRSRASALANWTGAEPNQGGKLSYVLLVLPYSSSNN